MIRYLSRASTYVYTQRENQEVDITISPGQMIPRVSCGIEEYWKGLSLSGFVACYHLEDDQFWKSGSVI